MIHVDILKQEFDPSPVPFTITMGIGEEFKFRFKNAGIQYPTEHESTIMISRQAMRKLLAGKDLSSIRTTELSHSSDNLKVEFRDNYDSSALPYSVLSRWKRECESSIRSNETIRKDYITFNG